MWDPLGVTSPAVLVPAGRVLGLFLLSPAHNPWRWQVGPKSHPEAVVTCCPSEARVLPHASCTLGWTLKKGPLASLPRDGSPLPISVLGPLWFSACLGTTLSHYPSSGAMTEATGLGFPDSQVLYLLACG